MLQEHFQPSNQRLKQSPSTGDGEFLRVMIVIMSLMMVVKGKFDTMA
jgi:hypothetical protein